MLNSVDPFQGLTFLPSTPIIKRLKNAAWGRY